MSQNTSYGAVASGLRARPSLTFLKTLFRPMWVILGLLTALSISVFVVLLINQLNFPLNLEEMEGTILQHVRRLAAGLPIYVQPSPEFVPLAYNPLYYLISIPFGWVFGLNLTALRLLATLALVGCGVLMYFIVARHAESKRWGLVAAGLFAASYRAMDAYLNGVHADSWFLFTVLLGSYVIDLNRSRRWNITGFLVLVSAFWFKQHGALFVVGGVLYLTWREGIKSSLVYWILAAILGPFLYWFIAPIFLGDYMRYFTLDVPGSWSVLRLSTIFRIIEHVLRWFPILAVMSVVELLGKVWRDYHRLSIWHVQLLFAVMSGFMGVMDPGSSDNIFAAMDTFFILMGVLGLYRLFTRPNTVYRLFALAVLSLCFVFLAYNPLNFVVSPAAHEKYDEFVGFLKSLDGTVYAPQLGQLDRGFELYPTLNWVAIEDLVRGPDHTVTDDPLTRELLDPLINPTGTTYVLTNIQLERDRLLLFLTDYYVLETDLGNRFEPLSALEHRFSIGWPRYLYRYEPS
jgi:hypothetical protein